MTFSPSDLMIIRDLARRVAEIGHDPLQAHNRELWYRHNALERVKPMVLIFPEGAWRELLPAEENLQCRDERLHGYEWHLRSLIYRWEHLRDDNVIEPRIRVNAVYRTTGWGVEVRHRQSGVDGGAWGFDPVIKDYADLEKLRKPVMELDEAATRRELEFAHELFEGILDVELYRKPYVNNQLVYTLCDLVGLDNLMLYLVDKPDFVHAAMDFMTRATLELMDDLEKNGCVEPNNRDDYVGSGGVGYSRELPTTGSPEKGYTFADCWGFAEAQEFALVSPEMQWEFVLQYQIRMLERYGLNCYGCCEPLDNKFDYVFRVPRLRRVSISPWSDVRRCAEILGDRAIFSWKPNPADLAGETFHPEVIAEKIRECVAAARDCVLEIIMKDTHTVRGDPRRMTEWVRIAKEIADRGYPS